MSAISIVQPIIWIVLYDALFRGSIEIPGFGAANYIAFLTPGVVRAFRIYQPSV